MSIKRKAWEWRGTQSNVNLKASPSPSYTEPQLTGYDVNDEKNIEREV